MSNSSDVSVKYAGKSLSAPGDTTCLELKRFLVGPTSGLAPSCMKLLSKGKVVKDDDLVAAGSKLMLMKCKATSETVRLHIREIVSGREPRDKVEVNKSMAHEDLVKLVVKALRLPPCDEYTEVRLYLPHQGALMRQDLKLSDYPPASDASDGSLEVFAVPCPISRDAKQLAAQAQAQADELERAQATHVRAARKGLADADDDEEAHRRADVLAEREMLLDELTAQATASMSSADAEVLRELMRAGGGESEGFALPASLVDEHGLAAGSSSSSSSTSTSTDGVAAASSSSSSGGSSSTKAAADASGAAAPKPTKPTPESLGVPSRIRTGLMPSAHDEPSVVHIELPPSLLDNFEGLEIACIPPTLAEWESYCAQEEERLEERCADLINSLAPSLPSPATSLRARGKALPKGVLRRSARSSSPNASERRRARRSRLEAAMAEAAAEVLGSSSSSAHSSCVGCDDDESSDDEQRQQSSDDAKLPAVEAVVASAPSPTKHQVKKGRTCSLTGCECRLPMTACTSACRCGEAFCAEHMHCHDCPVDYRKMQQSKLREDNPKLEGHKLERM